MGKEQTDFVNQNKNEVVNRKRKSRHARLKEEKINLKLNVPYNNPFGLEIGTPKLGIGKTSTDENILNEDTSHMSNFRQKVTYSLSMVGYPYILNRLIKTFVSSSIFFILAYLTLYVAGTGITLLLAEFWDIKARFYYNFIEFSTSIYSPLWNEEASISIHLASPVICFILSFVAIERFKKKMSSDYYQKMYYMWMIIIGQALSLGSFIASFFTYSGVYHALSINLEKTWFSHGAIEYLMVLVATLWLLYFGSKIKNVFLFSSVSKLLLQPKNRFLLYFFLLVFPFVFGTLTLLSYNLPKYSNYGLIQFMTILILFIPALLERDDHSYELGNFKTTKPKMRNSKLVIITIVIMVFYRLILQYNVVHS